MLHTRQASSHVASHASATLQLGLLNQIILQLEFPRILLLKSIALRDRGPQLPHILLPRCTNIMESRVRNSAGPLHPSPHLLRNAASTRLVPLLSRPLEGATVQIRLAQLARRVGFCHLVDLGDGDDVHGLLEEQLGHHEVLQLRHLEQVSSHPNAAKLSRDELLSIGATEFACVHPALNVAKQLWGHVAGGVGFCVAFEGIAEDWGVVAGELLVEMVFHLVVTFADDDFDQIESGAGDFVNGSSPGFAWIWCNVRETGSFLLFDRSRSAADGDLGGSHHL